MKPISAKQREGIEFLNKNPGAKVIVYEDEEPSNCTRADLESYIAQKRKEHEEEMALLESIARNY